MLWTGRATCIEALFCFAGRGDKYAAALWVWYIYRREHCIQPSDLNVRPTGAGSRDMAHQARISTESS